MNFQDLINKLMLLSNKDMLKTVGEIYKYENITFTPDMFFASTPTYLLNFQNSITGNDEQWLEPFYLKHVIPDFIIDNFATLRGEDTKIMNDFLRLFLVRILALNLIFTVKKQQNLYLSPLKSYQYTISTINNRKNVEYFFRFYFKRKVKIIENVPESDLSCHQFKLGQTVLKSTLVDNSPSLGTKVLTALHKYNVHIDLGFEELTKLEDCVLALTKHKLIILKSNANVTNLKKRYYYSLSFVGTVLKGIYAFF